MRTLVPRRAVSDHRTGRDRPASRRTGRVLVAGALVMAAALAGCSGEQSKAGSAAPASASRAASPSATPPRSLLAVRLVRAGLTARQRRVATVVGEYWTRYGTAVSTRDLAGSGLSGVVTTATGVGSTKRVVSALRSKGEHYQGKLVVTVAGVSFGGVTAIVNACVDQRRTHLVNRRGRTVVEPNKQNVLPVAHTLVQRDGVWLVDKIEQGAFAC